MACTHEQKRFQWLQNRYDFGRSHGEEVNGKMTRKSKIETRRKKEKGGQELNHREWEMGNERSTLYMSTKVFTLSQ